MKSFILSATVVAVLLVVYVAADAQTPRNTAGPAPTIGIVDISYVFKHHQRLKQQTEGLKADMESAKNAMLKEKDRIQQQMEKLKTFKQGHADYNKHEEDVTHMQADYNAQTALKQKEFMEKESRIMMGVYREVADAVAVIAQQRGMTLVLKFNGDPVDPANRESVMREISKPFAYYSREADITPDVLAEVSRPTANPNLRGAARPGVPGRN